jgi:phosphopantothenoylcysteine synthetase/decarboxylase
MLLTMDTSNTTPTLEFYEGKKLGIRWRLATNQPIVNRSRAKYGYPRRGVGFAAEIEKSFEIARRKLQSKQLVLIVANDISTPKSGFSLDTIQMTMLIANINQESLPLQQKIKAAEFAIQKAIAWE